MSNKRNLNEQIMVSQGRASPRQPCKCHDQHRAQTQHQKEQAAPDKKVNSFRTRRRQSRANTNKWDVRRQPPRIDRRAGTPFCMLSRNACQNSQARRGSRGWSTERLYCVRRRVCRSRHGSRFAGCSAGFPYCTAVSSRHPFFPASIDTVWTRCHSNNRRPATHRCTCCPAHTRDKCC